MSSRARGLGFLILAASLWSIGGVFIKLVPWSPFAIAGGRSSIAAIVIAFFLGRKNFKFERADFITASFYAMTVVMFVTATKLTTAANAVFLQYTAPVYVVALAHFYLKERVTRQDLLAVFVVLLGMTLFFYEKMSLEGFWGNILAVCSGVTFAIMTVLFRARRHAVPLKSVFLGNLLAAAAMSPFVYEAPRLGFYESSYLLILGIFQLGLSYIAYAAAVPHVMALETVLVALLEPVLNPIWVVLTIGERPSVMSILGGGIIVAAVTIRSLLGSRPVSPPMP